MSWLSVLGPTVPWEATASRIGAGSTVVTRTVSGMGSGAFGSRRGAVAMSVSAAKIDTTTTTDGIRTVLVIGRLPPGALVVPPG